MIVGAHYRDMMSTMKCKVRQKHDAIEEQCDKIIITSN